MDLCDICSIILPDEKIKKNLKIFSTRLQCQQLEDQRMHVEEKLYDSATKPRTASKVLATSTLCVILSVTALLFEFLSESILSKYNSIIIFMAAMISLSSILFITATDAFRESRKAKQKHERELRAIEAEIEKLNRFQKEHLSNL